MKKIQQEYLKQQKELLASISKVMGDELLPIKRQEEEKESNLKSFVKVSSNYTKLEEAYKEAQLTKLGEESAQRTFKISYTRLLKEYHSKEITSNWYYNQLKIATNPLRKYSAIDTENFTIFLRKVDELAVALSKEINELNIHTIISLLEEVKQFKKLAEDNLQGIFSYPLDAEELINFYDKLISSSDLLEKSYLNKESLSIEKQKILYQAIKYGPSGGLTPSLLVDPIEDWRMLGEQIYKDIQTEEKESQLKSFVKTSSQSQKHKLIRLKIFKESSEKLYNEYQQDKSYKPVNGNRYHHYIRTIASAIPSLKKIAISTDDLEAFVAKTKLIEEMLESDPDQLNLEKLVVFYEAAQHYRLRASQELGVQLSYFKEAKQVIDLFYEIRNNPAKIKKQYEDKNNLSEYEKKALYQAILSVPSSDISTLLMIDESPMWRSLGEQIYKDIQTEEKESNLQAFVKVSSYDPSSSPTRDKFNRLNIFKASCTSLYKDYSQNKSYKHLNKTRAYSYIRSIEVGSTSLKRVGISTSDLDAFISKVKHIENMIDDDKKIDQLDINNLREAYSDAEFYRTTAEKDLKAQLSYFREAKQILDFFDSTSNDAERLKECYQNKEDLSNHQKKALYQALLYGESQAVLPLLLTDTNPIWRNLGEIISKDIQTEEKEGNLKSFVKVSSDYTKLEKINKEAEVERWLLNKQDYPSFSFCKGEELKSLTWAAASVGIALRTRVTKEQFKKTAKAIFAIEIKTDEATSALQTFTNIRRRFRENMFDSRSLRIDIDTLEELKEKAFEELRELYNDVLPKLQELLGLVNQIENQQPSFMELEDFYKKQKDSDHRAFILYSIKQYLSLSPEDITLALTSSDPTIRMVGERLKKDLDHHQGLAEKYEESSLKSFVKTSSDYGGRQLPDELTLPSESNYPYPEKRENNNATDTLRRKELEHKLKKWKELVEKN